MVDEVIQADKPAKAAKTVKTVKIQVDGELFENPNGTPIYYKTGMEVELTDFLQQQIDAGLAKII